MTARAAALAGLLCLCAALPAGAACGDPARGRRLGLVLSGGGARGIAHVGVLKALEEQGVRPDCIAGTSMGALVGALYASGYSARRIEEIVRSVDWQRIYSGRAERSLVPVARRVEEVRPLVRLGFELWRLRLPRAADPDYRMRRFLVALLTSPALQAGRDFDRLPIPFRAVTTDLATGERVVLGTGSLEAAVRASVSAPVALEPVREAGRWLVDGGVVDNMPVSVAREMGADVVIAVDVRSPPTLPTDQTDAMGVAGVLADMLIRRRNEDFRAEAEVVVEPPLEGLLNTDYPAFERAIAAGYEAARGQASAIAAAVGPTEQARPAAAGPASPAAAPAPRVVTGVRVEGEEDVRESAVLQAFALRAGQPFDLQAALRGLDAVWATRLFRSAWLDVLPGAAGVEVVVHVREAPRSVVEVAASFEETDKAEGLVSLRDRNLFGHGETLELRGQASDARSAVRLEFAADGLLGSPLGYVLRASVAEWRPRPFVAEAPLARAEFDRVALEGALQTHPLAALLLRGGVERAHAGTAAHEEAGIAAGEADLLTIGGLAVWDTLDDRWDPTHGAMVTLRADHGLRALGADTAYWRALAAARAAVTLGRAGTLQLDALGFTSGEDIPLHEQVQFGGPVLVPGVARDALWGPHGGAIALSHRFRITGGLQMVARAGLGGVWDERAEASLDSARRGFGVGLRHSSPVGPLAIEWGREGGRARVYVSIGYE